MTSLAAQAFDLSRGAPVLASVPLQAFLGEKDLPNLTEIVRKNPDTLLYKGSGVAGHNFKGYGPLREVLAANHHVHPDQVIIRNGGMDVMTHVLQYLLSERANSANPNEPIAVATEVPTYDRFPVNLKIHGIGWAGVSLTSSGINLEELKKAVSRPEVKLFYGIYEGQNPTGYSYSEAERKAVEKICADTNTLVLWDGAYHHLTYGYTNPELSDLPAHVILQRNYTKEISAGFKCGYIVVPEHLAKKFDHIVCNTGLNPNYPTQAWIHAFITSPEYQIHLESLREMFGPKAAHLVRELKRVSPEAKFHEGVSAGYFLEVTYPNVTDRERFVEELKKENVVISDSRLSYPAEWQDQVQGKVRIPFATLSLEEISEVCERIEKAANNAK